MKYLKLIFFNFFLFFLVEGSYAACPADPPSLDCPCDNTAIVEIRYNYICEASMTDYRITKLPDSVLLYTDPNCSSGQQLAEIEKIDFESSSIEPNKIDKIPITIKFVSNYSCLPTVKVCPVVACAI